MNWKAFKQMVNVHNFADESKFILGVDVGTYGSTVSFYNVLRREPEVLDMSGGYGSATVPTVLQYIPETKEWIFGEYALLNKGYFNDVTLTKLTQKLGRNEFLDIDGKLMPVYAVLGKYIKELAGFCKNINPNAEIAGIISSAPYYMEKDALEEFSKAFTAAHLQKELISFTSDKECILRYYHKKNPPPAQENILLLDYGANDLRGGLMKIEKEGDTIHVHNVSYIYDTRLGTNHINQSLVNMLSLMYCNEFRIKPKMLDPAHFTHIENIMHQNKNLLFHANLKEKPVKIYFNFCYPPFQKEINHDMFKEIIRPYQHYFNLLIQNILNKTIGTTVTVKEIDKIICVGGGFEMHFAKEMLKQTFPDTEIIFYKNSQSIVSQGACYHAASIFGFEKDFTYQFTDKHLILEDVGIKALSGHKEKFIPLIEKNSFWWKNNISKVFILNQDTKEPVRFEIYKRNDKGDLTALQQITISQLPQRPKGTTRLKFSLQFKEYNTLLMTIKDLGFGELFAVSDFEETYSVQYI